MVIGKSMRVSDPQVCCFTESAHGVAEHRHYTQKTKYLFHNFNCFWRPASPLGNFDKKEMARESVPVTRPAYQGSCIPPQTERAIQRTHAEYVMNRCHTYPSRAIYHCFGLGCGLNLQDSDMPSTKRK